MGTRTCSGSLPKHKDAKIRRAAARACSMIRSWSLVPVLLWSSGSALCGMRGDLLLTLHPTQYSLGMTTKDRGGAYRAIPRDALDDENLASIRARLQQQRAYGRDDFRAMVEAKTQRFAGVLPAHRPARVAPEIGK